MKKPALDEREFAIHYAKVNLTECARRRHQGAFWFFLFAAAQRARLRAAALTKRDLFGAVT